MLATWRETGSVFCNTLLVEKSLMGDTQSEQDQREQARDAVYRGEQFGDQNVIKLYKCQQEEMSKPEHVVFQRNGDQCKCETQHDPANKPMVLQMFDT